MLNMLRTQPPKGANITQQLAWRAQRFEAAKAAAPYCHPRMGATEIDPQKTADAARKIREQLAEMESTTGVAPTSATDDASAPSSASETKQ